MISVEDWAEIRRLHHAEGMGIKAIPLRDDWAYRELKIVTRDPAGLSTVTKMLVEHLADRGGTADDGERPLLDVGPGLLLGQE